MKRIFILCFYLEKVNNECVKGTLVVMYEKVLFVEKKCVQTKEHGRKLCVASSCGGFMK
jgi:hypothetical protein